jgi:hypothetical protein
VKLVEGAGFGEGDGDCVVEGVNVGVKVEGGVCRVGVGDGLDIEEGEAIGVNPGVDVGTGVGKGVNVRGRVGEAEGWSVAVGSGLGEAVEFWIGSGIAV